MNHTDGFDVSAFHRGVSYNIYEYLGAHKRAAKAVFRVWAPHADKVFTVGDFNYWSESEPMTKISDKGIWECTVDYHRVINAPLYKFKIIQGSQVLYKADPYCRQMQHPPETASVFCETDNTFNWTDSHWLSLRAKRYAANKAFCPTNIYQVHLGSFMRREDGSCMNYRELAPLLASYAKKMSYSHVELLPISEHPHEYSLGYESSGLYTVSSRYGTPDDFKYLINTMHNCGVGVILSWVPSKFSDCEHGLSLFDGKPLYENYNTDDSRQGSAVPYDLSKNEVRSFLISNACYYARDYHIDGIRVCDLSSVLYLDHDRSKGKWKPNRHGGNVNFEAVSFIKQLNSTLRYLCPDVLRIADDTGEYKNVVGTEPHSLGFDLKWNNNLKQKSLQAVTDNFEAGLDCFEYLFNSHIREYDVLPLSHDEFAYPNRSLLSRMTGDYNMKFAAHRAYTLCTTCLPTKKLSFMSCEFGQFAEWSYNSPVEWFMLDYDMHNKLHRYTAELNALYISNRPLWSSIKNNGYKVLDHSTQDNKITAFKRTDDTDKEIIVIVSFSERSSSISIRELYGRYKMLLSSDSSLYGGNKTYATTFYQANNELRFDLAPFECIILKKDT